MVVSRHAGRDEIVLRIVVVGHVVLLFKRRGNNDFIRAAALDRILRAQGGVEHSVLEIDGLEIEQVGIGHLARRRAERRNRSHAVECREYHARREIEQFVLLRAEFHEMLLFIFCEQFVDIFVFAAVDIVAFNAVAVFYVILELVIAVVEVDRVQIVVELDFVRPAVFNGGIAQLFDIAFEILALLALGAVLFIFVNAPADERPAAECEHHAVSNIHAYFAAEHGCRLGEKISWVFFTSYTDEELYLVPAFCGKFAEERREIDNIDC